MFKLSYLKSFFYHSPLLYRRFNNTLNPVINLKYYRHASRCKKSYEKRSGNKIYDNKSPVRSAGVHHVQGVLSRDIANSYSHLIDELISINSSKLTNTGNSIVVEKPITNLGFDLINIFHNENLKLEIMKYFGGHFMVKWLDCYRSIPSEDNGTSWLWHSDNVPTETLKLMLLLTDAPKEKGATLFMSRDDTNRYRQKGYWGTKVSERVADLNSFAHDEGLPYEPFCKEASAGDVLLFDNNNLHKAVPPVSGYRDACTYLIFPSDEPFERCINNCKISDLEDRPGGYPSKGPNSHASY